MKALFVSWLPPSLASALPQRGLHVSRADDVFKMAKFGYHGLTGPLNWHTLSENNTECAAGRYQSPINLDESVSGVSVVNGEALEIRFEDASEGVEILNKGTTLEASARGSLALEKKEYALQQFHFHAPSEHHVEGHVFAMEAHFVFEAEGRHPCGCGT